MRNELKTLVVRFANELQPYEIPWFRGAIIGVVGAEGAPLFHNHLGDGFRYRYPLIQYKRIGGKGALVCVGEGVDEVGRFFSSGDFDIAIGERSVHLELERVQPRKTLVQVWDGEFEYHLREWMPLNQANYARYQQTEGLVERTQMLERILTGNILSMCKGVGIEVEKEIVCRITQMDPMWQTRFKGVRTSCVNVEFKSNVSLPDFIGLGKGTSLGYGIVTRKYNKE